MSSVRTCPSCHTALAGETVRCPQCQNVVGLSAGEPAPAAALPGFRPYPGDSTFRLPASPVEENVQTRPTNWMQIRFGFDLVIVATLLTAGAAGSLVAISSAGVAPHAVGGIAKILGVLVLVGALLQWIGQELVCGVPEGCGRPLCRAAAWAQLVAFGVTAIVILVFFRTPAGQGDAPGGEAAPPTALGWALLLADGVATVLWFLFLHQLALAQHRPGLASLVQVLLLCVAGYALLVLALTAKGVLADPTRDEVARMTLLGTLGGGGLLILGFYLSVLTRVRTLIAPRKRMAP